MTIGSLRLEIFLPASRSLKDKRRVVRSLKDRLRGRYNISLAEVDHQETHQRTALGIVSIANDRQQIERLFQKLQTDVERAIPGDLLEVEIEILR
ncbi:MAG: DUF503 domain-containing protein [Acidobacteriota bacterium]